AGIRLNLRLQVISVTNGEGESWWYSRSRKGDSVYLKIGDKNRMFSDTQVYVIEYRVQRGVGFFDDHDELYWNAIGDGWPVTIKSGICTVHLPEQIDSAGISIAGYTGPFGSRNRECTGEITADGAIVFKTTKPLRSGEGMTVLVGWPPGIVQEPGTGQKLLWFAADNWPLFVPFAAVIVLLLLWLAYGRDPRGRGTVVVQYEPPEGVTPLEAGAIIDEKLDARDITASIVQLAIKGYLRIEQYGLSVDFIRFVKLRDFEGDRSLAEHEIFILRKIFESGPSVKMLDLPRTFALSVRALRKKTYRDLVKNGYFSRNPASIRASYLAAGIVVAVAGLFVEAFTGSALHVLAFAVAGVLVLLSGRLMPRKTRKGVKVVEHIRGLEEFILRAEKESIQEAEKQMVFEKLLPYAMVVGVDLQLSAAFSDVYEKYPSWYSGYRQGTQGVSFSTFTIRSTSRGILSGVSSATRTTSFGSGISGFSSGGGGGGGFSGGGGGGGGGGGW
ncbi:MAG: DUF2207 domain-containing protein, partial [Planctomycetota bacterium]